MADEQQLQESELKPAAGKAAHSTKRLVIISSIAVVVVAAGIGGGLWWNSSRNVAPAPETSVPSAAPATDAGTAPAEESHATETPAPAVEPAATQSEDVEVQPEAAAPEAKNAMVVIYENDDYALSMPADKAEYAQWVQGGSLDRNTNWDSFSYNPPEANSGAGLTITTALIDASSSPDPHFEQVIGSNSMGVNVYAMQAGGTFLGDDGAGGVVTLK